MRIFIQLLSIAMVSTTVLSLPVPSLDEQSLVNLVQLESLLQQRLASSQQAYQQTFDDASVLNLDVSVQDDEEVAQLQSLVSILDMMMKNRVTTQQARAMIQQQQLGGQLSKVIQRTAENLLDKMESSPPTPAGPTVNFKSGVKPGMGVKFHFKSPAQEQPQPYYQPQPANPPMLRRPRIIVPIRRPRPVVPHVPVVPSVPHVHIHPIKPVAPIAPVPKIPSIHIHPTHSLPPPPPPAPKRHHIHIHPIHTSNQKVIKPLSPMPALPPRPPIKPIRPMPSAPVLHIHPPTSPKVPEKPYDGKYKHRKENDVQLKLNMDFKAHNRTGFQELQRMMNQVEIQNDYQQAMIADINARKQEAEVEDLKNLLRAVVQNKISVQELSNIVRGQEMKREVAAQYYD